MAAGIPSVLHEDHDHHDKMTALKSRMTKMGRRKAAKNTEIKKL